MKILIVDDSMIMRRIQKTILIKKKVDENNILEATDGEAALYTSKSETVGLFLVDWTMPKLNGLQFVQAVRSMDKYKETPIIMVTSLAAKYNVMEAVNAGVTDYIIKPIKEDQLWEKIKKYF